MKTPGDACTTEAVTSELGPIFGLAKVISETAAGEGIGPHVLMWATAMVLGRAAAMCDMSGCQQHDHLAGATALARQMCDEAVKRAASRQKEGEA